LFWGGGGSLWKQESRKNQHIQQPNNSDGDRRHANLKDVYVIYWLSGLDVSPVVQRHYQQVRAGPNDGAHP